jgi:hypothetical protein
MHIPSSIQSKLTGDYEGLRAARFDNSVEAKNFETMMADARLSYRTKITKHKKRGREFVVMLLEVPQWH